MKELKVFEQNGQVLTDSREVAEMVERSHNELLKSIRSYCRHLNEGEIPPVEFFIESSYQDTKGETRPCYLITKKGCDMVANKMTGQKGVLFTAAYVTAFEDMKEQILNQKYITGYKTKRTSAGEVASLLKILRGVMKDQKSPPEDIAKMTDMICDQFGISLPENFVVENLYPQLMMVFIQ